jgi:transitional endoplasmic reticulum ATPase
MNEDITLKVAEAYHQDVGRGIVRIDREVMRKLGVQTGDFVEIVGSKSAYAKVLPRDPREEIYDREIIRMDGYLRRAAGVSIGDRVSVKKAEVKEAQRVVLAPAREMQLTNLQGLKTVLRNDMINMPVWEGMNLRYHGMYGMIGEPIVFTVVQTRPSGVVVVTERTQIDIRERAEEIGAIPEVTYEDIGGLKKELEQVREMIELPMKHPELFRRLGIEPPKGVLLHGPPGTGKTLIAKAVANEVQANFYSIAGPEIMSKYYGESEKQLREIFEKAEENAPSIIFIDEIDSIAPKREEVTGEVERRVVAQLLTLMDGLKSRGKVVVIAATNRPDAVDPALRRPGRFDREIEIGVPDKNGRKEILEVHTRKMPLADDVDLEELAERTHGFVGADIAALCKEAAMNALRRVIPKIDIEAEEIPKEIIESLVVTRDDFMEALKKVEPSAMREVLVEVPEVRWDDIGGLEDVKQELREAVEWPLKYPEAFEALNTEPPKGILLYGPPGTGKTLLAKAVANESDANFISIKGPEIMSKWVGESEKAIREIFKKARQTAPTIVFLDELDSIAPRRGEGFDSNVTERVVSQLLTEMDGLEELRGVVVIAATNRPDIIDPALLRPGRLDRLIYVGPPDFEARKAIFKVHLKGKPLAEDVDIDHLAKITDGYVGADIEAIVREASLLAMRETIKLGDSREEVKKKLKDLKIEKRHFEEALKKLKPTVTKDELERYKALYARFTRNKEFAKPGAEVA